MVAVTQGRHPAGENKPMNPTSSSQRSPWLFIPTLYFMQGLPYMLVTGVSMLAYRKMGVGVADIATWTSLVTWPWVLKMFWGPIVDSNSTKRKWVLWTQGLLFLGMLAVAFGLHLPAFFTITLTIFFIMGFLSATHDIACDGFYLLALDKAQQAFFVGIRSAAFRGAMLFTNGVIVVVAGLLEERGHPAAHNWTIAFLVGAIAYGLCYLYGLWALPRPAEDVQGGVREEGKGVPFVEAAVTYFRQPKIVWVLLFILLFRVGEAMVMKIAPLFLIDPAEKGGLGVTTVQVGVINGTVGMIALTIGGLLGGIVVAKYGFKKTLWPLVICMHTPILLYVWAAYTRPHLAAVYGVVAVDNFGYGFGLAAYMVYLMLVSQTTKYKTSHYAISTGIMALGAMGAGIASGYLQEWLGYARFFVACTLCTIPATLVLFFIPMYDNTPDDEAPKDTLEEAAVTES